MATAAEFCNRHVVIARPGEGLGAVAARMLEERVGCVVVVRDGAAGALEPIGILTDRDIVVGALAHSERHLHALSVRDAMTTELVTALEREPVEDVFKRMRSFGVRRIPIVTEAGALAGLISFDDWIGLLSEQISDLAALLARERKHEAERRLSS